MNPRTVFTLWMLLALAHLLMPVFGRTVPNSYLAALICVLVALLVGSREKS